MSFMMKSQNSHTSCFLYGLHKSALFNVYRNCRFLGKGHNFRDGLSHLGYTPAVIIRKRFSFSGVTILGFYHRTPEIADELKMNDKNTIQNTR